MEKFYTNLTSKDFLTHLHRQLESALAIHEGANILVGVSGGPDSMTLLHALSLPPRRFNIQALYVDHCLRPKETPAEKALISSYCQEWEIPFYSATANVPQFKNQSGKSPEDAARTLRYRVLEEYRQKIGADYIAIAHTADDQVEEFFLRLGRGTGLTGLSGMKARKGHIIRPLLAYTKKQLLQYLQDYNISFSQDSSNSDRKFLRNKVRLDFMPLLEEQFFPGISAKILQTMEILQAEDDFITASAAEIFQSCVTPLAGGFLLHTDQFIAAHKSLQRRVLEQCCISINSIPSFQIISQLQEQIWSGELPRELHLTNGGRVTELHGDLLFSKPVLHDKREKAPTAAPVYLKIGKPCTIPIPGTDRQLSVATQTSDKINISKTPPTTLLADMDNVQFPLLLRSSRPGERFRPFKSSGSKKVSRYLNEKKIPARERNSWPLLVAAEEPATIIAIPGLTIDDAFQLTETTRRILVIRLQYFTRERPENI